MSTSISALGKELDWEYLYKSAQERLRITRYYGIPNSMYRAKVYINSLVGLRESLCTLLAPHLKDIIITTPLPAYLSIVLILDKDKWHWRHELYYEAYRYLKEYLMWPGRWELSVGVFDSRNKKRIYTWQSVILK